MKFTDDEIVIEPGHETRSWQSCNYSVRGQHLFHERTYMRSVPRNLSSSPRPLGVTYWLANSGVRSEQWLPGYGSQGEIEALAAKHGGHALEDFYPDEEEGQAPLHFLAFRDTDKALAFCRTKDFDRLCLTMEKV